MRNHLHNKRGFTLLIAVVTVSIILGLSMAIANITLKGYQFASVNSKSELAVYAADAALDCAINGQKLGTLLTNNSVTCMGASRPVTSAYDADGNEIYTFQMQWGTPVRSANVKLTHVSCGWMCDAYKIESSGFNASIADQGKDRTVERVIKMEY